MGMIEYPPAYLYLAALSGLFWTLTYILIIKRGWQDKAHGMPMWALAMNISWEFIYSFITPSPYPQRIINMIWFGFDVIILYHFITSWKVDYKEIADKYFYPFVVLVFATAFLGVLFIQYDSIPIEGYPLGMGRAYSAFGMNLIMSILYVHFIIKRDSIAGQSLYIALCKMIGTIFASSVFIIWAGQLPGVPAASSFVFPLMYAAIFLFDLIYCVQVYVKTKQIGLDPWTRF